MAGALATLRRDFVERFGREPEPNDPLLVDPAAAAPPPLSAEAGGPRGLNGRVRTGLTWVGRFYSVLLPSEKRKVITPR